MKNKQKKVRPAEAAPEQFSSRVELPAFVLLCVFALWSYFVVKSYFLANRFDPFSANLLRWIFSTEAYPGRLSPAVFLSHLKNLGLAALIFFGAYGYGSKLFSEPAGEQPLVRIALGLGVIIFATLAAGFTGFLFAPVIAAVVGLGALLAAVDLARAPGTSKREPQKKIGGVYYLPIAVIAAAIIANLIGALAPETFYDSLVYNIGLPQNWINFHTIFSDKRILVSFFPLNFSVLYTVGILLGSDITAKLMSFSFMAGTLVAVYLFGRKHVSSQAGVLAALIFFTVPLVMNISCKTAIEPGLAFFEFLAIFSFINWSSSASNNSKWFYVSALCAGIAMGGKYTGFLTTLCLGFMILFKIIIQDRKPAFTAAKYALLFSGIVFLTCSVWYVKNFVVIGDPFYPMLLKLGNQLHGNDPAPIKLTASNVFLFPWKYTMGSMQQETFMGPLFLILLPLAVLFRSRDKKIQLLWVYFALYFIMWFFIGKAYLRFFVPGMAVLSLLLAGYLTKLPVKYGLKNLAIVFISIIGFTNILHALLIMKTTMDPLGYDLGMQDRKDYLSIQRSSYPNSYYSAADWINHNAGKTAKVLIMGECRGFYVERPFLDHLANEPNPFVFYVNASGSDDDLYRKLQADGVSYILLNVPEAVRLASYDCIRFEPKELPVVNAFWNKHIKMVYSFCGDVALNDGRRGSRVPEFWNNYSRNPYSYVYVFEIVPDNGAPATPPPHNFLLDQHLFSDSMKKVLADYDSKPATAK
jgi:hypothetical protein